MSGNAFGRAWVLADLLKQDYDVHIVAACGARDELWTPARGSCDVEIRRWNAFSTPGFVARAPSISRRLVTGDVIFAVKPKLSSYGLGLFARRERNRPLLLDIDDWDVGFTSRAGDLLTAPWALLSAASGVHTRLLSRQTARADAITVSSSFLHARFGGTWLPHARDEQVFTSAVKAQDAGIPTVVFAGTPRRHKGLDDLIRAFAEVRAPARLRIIGGTLDPDLKGRPEIARDPRISVEPPVPMSQLPSELQAADIIVIPQQGGIVSEAQLPAKLLDAMAMGKAVVSTRVGDIPRWLAEDAGVVVAPGDVPALRDALEALLTDPARRAALGARARSRFLQLGSVSALRPRLVELVESVRQGARRPFTPAPFSELEGSAKADPNIVR